MRKGIKHTEREFERERRKAAAVEAMWSPGRREFRYVRVASFR